MDHHDQLEQDRRNAKLVLIAMPWVIFLLFMQVFNENVFSLVTPKIADDFAISPGTVSWVVTIGGVILGVGGAVYAALSDSLSFRKLFLFGVIAFAAGSLLASPFNLRLCWSLWPEPFNA
ncbi:hypothetical protein SD70_24395 [Gordoniibacillus kamchatkensis]|uniref:Major facilitator superfamily (MFS) profile domain-containing protein n=1 Tax=Gordoniibacillus kamchatkensis TaxID=1590651 RepID=A0ABR5ACJ9_9BACL|nr:hypothetical protein SD70_24395 [Paenibacillus sp. VKM B-2647]